LSSKSRSATEPASYSWFSHPEVQVEEEPAALAEPLQVAPCHSCSGGGDGGVWSKTSSADAQPPARTGVAGRERGDL
jgi:hypothetical protein